MKKAVAVSALIALLACLSSVSWAFAKEYRIYRELTHEMRSADKYDYTREQFAEKGYVMPSVSAAERDERQKRNDDIINGFYEKVGKGEKAALNIVFWTVEGRPVFRHFYFNGRSWRYVFDQSRDGFSDMKIERSVCKEGRIPEQAGAEPIVELTDCKTYRSEIFVY